MEWHKNPCSFCQGFNYFYCDNFFFMLDTILYVLTKNIEKLHNFGSSSDVLLLEKFLWMSSIAYSLLIRISFIKMSLSYPLYSILTSIFSFSLVNCSISKSHLQSSARCCDRVFGLSDSKAGSASTTNPFYSVIFPFTFPAFTCRE